MSKALVAHTLRHARRNPAFASAFKKALLHVAAVRMEEGRFWGLVSKIGWPENQDIAGVLFEEVDSDQELLAFLRTFQDQMEELVEAVQENLAQTPVGQIADQEVISSFGDREAAAIVALGKSSYEKCLGSIEAVTSVMGSDEYDGGCLSLMDTSATISQYLDYRESYNALSEEARSLVEVFKGARSALNSKIDEARGLLDSSSSKIQTYLSALTAQQTSKVEDMRESGEISSALVDFSLAVDVLSDVAEALQTLQDPLNRQITAMI